jgi:hypothetical protein
MALQGKVAGVNFQYESSLNEVAVIGYGTKKIRGIGSVKNHYM